ncbi:DUF5916 domain-containing protein [Sunxiuqinia sp. A32]|uniref:DUF5916 domain-containing protein n=1 Tax=Sunxiuqinia sp. A32 TaxID=3461496 RepID=UPI004045A49E
MKKYFMLVVFLFVLGISVNAHLKSQPDSLKTTFNSDYVLHVKKTTEKIIVDGKFDENAWQKAEVASDFQKVLPVDDEKSDIRSEVLMTYDDKAFYLGFIFFDTIPGKRVMESYRRDFIFNNNDNFLVFFDTFLDQTNGFTFGVSASGAKWDGIMYDGRSSNLNWDCKWESKTVHYDDRWVTEMKIPFRSIRFKSGADQWNVNFSRLDLKSNEKSAWAPVPRSFPTSSLAYTGVLKWEEPLPESKMMFSMIPYLFGSASRDFESGTDTDYRKDFGFDVKLGVSTSMNLDLTYNPDFAQAEVDEQVTNLDRFELFFPEKRQFFLENSDLFADYGYETVTPFFSRRIGLDAPVLAGARLSGKLDKNWRLGLMNIQTEKAGEFLARNYSVASVQRKVFSRSNIGFIFANKENLDEPSNAQDFNRVVGMDYNLANSDNSWKGKLFYHQSFDERENTKGTYAQGAYLVYNKKNLEVSVSETSVGRDYNAEVGFVRRTGYNFLGAGVRYTWVPNKTIISHGFVLDTENYFDVNYNKIDHEQTVAYEIGFKNRSNIEVGVKDFFVHLLEDFDPTHTSNYYLPKGSEYRYQGVWIDYESDNRKAFKWESTLIRGSFYNGNISAVEGGFGYRFQPYVNFSMNFSYNDIILPQPFERASFWLLGPKLDLTFSDKLFLTTFVQYNEQIENLNLNMRFQWRYKPVSDFFLVYTDNYFTGDWSPRNRAMVVKLSYWFN